MTEVRRSLLARRARPVLATTTRGVDATMVLWMVSLSGLWGLNAITIKAVTTGMAPLLAAGLRGLVALVLLVAWGAWRGERLLYRGHLLRHSIVAGLMFAAEFCLFYTGARMTTGGHVAIYINMAPFFVAAGAHFLLPGDRMTWLRWAGLVLAFAGVVVLFSGDLATGQGGYLRGDLLVIAGAAVWGLTTLYIKRYMVAEMSGFELLYVQIAVSTPVLLVLAALWHPGALAAIAPLSWGIVLFQGIVVVFFSYLAWMTLLRIYPASAMQSFTFLTPVWGVALGALMLGERVTIATFAAIALVGLGLYLVNRPARA
ncbi:MAG TPA: DMT family transporter [bacterium]|nr:DMT family transporter [bacterium]